MSLVSGISNVNNSSIGRNSATVGSREANVELFALAQAKSEPIPSRDFDLPPGEHRDSSRATIPRLGSQARANHWRQGGERDARAGASGGLDALERPGNR